MSEAKWHTVDECIELGLVDESMDGKPADITEQTQDFIKYNNLPVLPEVVNSWYDKSQASSTEFSVKINLKTNY